MDLKEYDKARECFANAVELAPRQSLFRSGLFDATLAAGDAAQVERVLEEGLRAMGSDPGFLNNAAWFLATGDAGTRRDPQAAVDYAERAVSIQPEDGNHWNTLGTARYYAGDLEGAVEALLESMRLAQGGAVYDWLFLAMAYRGLGDSRSADFWYQRSVMWMEEHQDEYDPDLVTFRAEADALFGE